jgi:DNA-directed RNA polymerase I subunit RPA2
MDEDGDARPDRIVENENTWKPDFLKEAVANHVESFNWLINDGLPRIVENLDPVVIEDPDDPDASFVFKLESLKVGYPAKPKIDNFDEDVAGYTRNVYPSDCRELHTTYSAPLTSKFSYHVKSLGEVRQDCPADLGEIPIMVASTRCHLRNCGAAELSMRKEDPKEVGGYFIVNGNEKVVRLLVAQRANYIVAIERSSYTNRGPAYTPYATVMRCMRTDQTTQTISLHYKRDGLCTVRVSWKKNEYLVPMIPLAIAFSGCTAQDLCNRLTGPSDEIIEQRASFMIEAHFRQVYGDKKIKTQADALSWLGGLLRVVAGLPNYYSDERVGKAMCDQLFFVHCQNDYEKFDCLAVMFRKLISLVTRRIKTDNPDGFCNHECLLPGQLYGAVLKEALQGYLDRVRP